MNKRLSLLTAALLLTGASSAFAMSSTDLTVTGIITPGACTPTLANSGVVDFGKIPAKDLQPTTHTRLDDKTIQLTVNCDASKQFAISFMDQRENTASEGGNWAFGLGLTSANEKLGRYRLGFRNPVADTSVTTMWSGDKGVTWAPFLESHVTGRDQWIAFGSATGGVWTPDFLQAVTVDITLNTAIAPANSLTLTDEVALDGSATLQIEYI